LWFHVHPVRMKVIQPQQVIMHVFVSHALSSLGF
jgi:hypothetical protein